MIYPDLILNLSLLVALSVVSGFIEERWPRHTRTGAMMQGALFGGAAALGMLRPLTLGPGLIFDGRSVMVSLCALFYGPLATLTATLMTTACRIRLEGEGMPTGVLVILSSAGIGLLAHFCFKPDEKPPSTRSLYLLGLAVHLTMVVLMFTLPGSNALSVVKRMGLPVVLLYPLATILVGKILSDRVSTIRYLSHLQQTKQNLEITLQSIGEAVISTDLEGGIVLMNPVAERLTGRQSGEAKGRPLEEVFHIVDEETRDTVENPVRRALRDSAMVELGSHTVLIAREGTARPIAASGSPIHDESGAISGVVLVFRDQTAERTAQQLTSVRLGLIEYAASHTLDELLSKALNKICTILGSSIGFFHFVEGDRKTLSLQQCPTRALKEFRRTEGEGPYDNIDRAGVWADCARERKPVIHNDYLSLKHKKGMPEGHADVVRELATPVMREGKVVAILGVGNKPADYTGKDAETIDRLAEVTWEVVERKRAEEVLQESETLFRNLFQYHAAVKFIIDPDTGNIIDANQAAENYYGWPIEQLKQMRIQDINTLSPEEMKQEMEKASTLKKVCFEFRHRRADGSVRNVEVFSSKIHVKRKDLLHSIIHDVTERKQVQAERERLLAAIEQTRDVIVITDPEGIIQYTNPAFETVSGYTRREVIGRRPNISKSGKHDETFYRGLWETITSGKTWTGHLINKRKDGELYTEEATISPVCDDSGKIVNYVAVKRDITEHLRLSAQFQQAQKMESVGRLAGGVAHDYNNMLGVIIGYTELAMQSVDPADRMHADLEEILKAARRSTDITRQLLAFARKQTISPVALDLNQTVESMLKMLRRLIGEDIDLAWLPKAALWPVKMDPAQIDQILANLCVNARDAIAGVGRISIETDKVTFDANYCANHAGFIPGEFVLLAVSDDGCGMDKGILENIFEPFFTTKTAEKGTGLGLATVYGIVKQNSGFINVYSEPGQGTTLRIYLPRLVGENEETKTEETVEASHGLGETVLLVEDELVLLNMSKRMLEKLGYRVLTAGSPGEALRMIHDHDGKIDLLMTDVIMPEMNGRELAEQAATIRPGLKCLFMSGYTANVIAHHGVLNADVEFIQKPFGLKDLGAKVRKVVKG